MQASAEPGDTDGAIGLADESPRTVVAPEKAAPRPARLGMARLSATLDPQLSLPPLTPSSLLVIDSRSLTRDCLVAALHSAGIGLIVAVPDIEQALRHVTEGKRFKAVFINLAADDFSPESLMAITVPLHEKLPDCPLLLLSDRMDSRHAAIALRHGVHGLLSRDLALDLTIAAIHFVERGWMLFPSEFMPALSTHGMMMEAGHPGLAWQLTNRQMEVLHHLRTGMSNKTIACLLDISERTVKAHVKELMRRFGVSNRTQIVALFGSGMGH